MKTIANLRIDSDKLSSYTATIGYEYNLDLQLFSSNTTNGVTQVNLNTVLESLGMNNKGTTSSFIFGNVFSEMFENDDINQNMYSVASGRMPESYNEVV